MVWEMEGNVDKRESWSEFINHAFVARQAAENKRIEAQQFAKWLDVHPSHVSRWLKGTTNPPTAALLKRVAAKLGPGAYEAAGQPPEMPDNPHAIRIVNRLSMLPEEYQEIFANMVEEAAEKAERAERIPRPGFFRQSAQPA
jgi:transcriptional regulator with XRE-family HTH domain